MTPRSRLLLVRHATTSETRRAAFPSTTGAAPSTSCPALDRAGRAAAEALAVHLPRADRAWSSHARRAVETAAAAGVHAVTDARLAECDFGRWSGSAAEEVARREPEALAEWYADPVAAPHGGESLAALRQRAGALLAEVAALDGTTLAFTHGGFVKAAVLAALELPDALVWRLDAAPSSVTELRADGHGGWRLVRLGWSPQLERSTSVPA